MAALIHDLARSQITAAIDQLIDNLVNLKDETGAFLLHLEDGRIIDTKGWSRIESLRRTAPRALEIAGVATILFLFAAYIEGQISPSELPYTFKALTAAVSTALLVGYVVVLGIRSRGEPLL